MASQVKVPGELDVWQDKVGGSFRQATLEAIQDVNREAARFYQAYEEAAMALSGSFQYSSMEGEISSLTVSA